MKIQNYISVYGRNGKGVVAALLLCSLLLGGCVQFIKPKVGSLAHEDARVAFTADGVTTGTLERQSLRIDYTMSVSGSDMNFSGTLTFDRSLTDSFPVIRSFFLNINFLDDTGAVIATQNITPMFSYQSDVKEKKPLSYSGPIPQGATGFAFNYYGIFRGDMPNMSETWDISYTPFD